MPATPSPATPWWLIYEDVAIRRRGAGYDVVRLTVPTAARLTRAANGAVLVDGRPVDFGDDFPCVLGLMDSVEDAEGRWTIATTEI